MRNHLAQDILIQTNTVTDPYIQIPSGIRNLDPSVEATEHMPTS
jgi:hypothetical protein